MSAEPAVEAVVVSVKDNSFIPEIITAPWKPGSNIFVTFQNDDDFEHILECRDYFEFPLVTLCAGHVVTYAFDNVGRFEITSKHNGCMKCIVDIPEDIPVVPVVFPHFMTSKEKALQKQEQQLKSNLGSDNDGNSSHASDNLMKFCYFGDKMLETDISCAVFQTPAVGENLSGDYAALVGDMQNRCGVDPTVIGSEESDINSSRDGTASLDGLDSDSRCSMEDLEELDRKFRQCSYSNRNPISQSRLASQMGDFQVPEIGDLKSEAADELMEVRNQRLAMKTISKKLVIPALESDECCWPGTTSSCGAGARCVPMADSGREVELKSEVAIQVERVNMGGVGNQISPSDEAEGDSVPITIAPSIKHKKTIPVSFRSRRIIYIRDYEFDVKNIAIFVDAPLEFRLSRDVPLHAEHILVGHSGSGVGGEQCFESPLLQQNNVNCFQYTPKKSGEIFVTCKIYSDMQCTVRVFDPTEDLNALALVGVGQKLLLNKEKDNSNAKSLGGYKNPGLTAKPGATSEKKRIVATSSGSAGLISPGVNLLAAPASTTAPPLLGYLGSRICGADSSACNMVPPPTGSLTPPRTPPKFSPNRNKGTPGRSVGSGTVGNLNATLSLLGTAEKQCNVHSSANSIASLSTASFFDSDDEFGSVGGGSVHGFTPRAHISQSSDNEEDFTEQRVTTPIEVHSVECCITDNVLPADTFRVLIENYTFRPSSISLVENQFVSFVAHSRDKHQLTCTRMSPRRDQIAESEFEVQLEGYGNSYVHHFAVPGKYLVKDEIFQFMSLYVTVLPDVEDASDDDTVDSVGFDNDLDEEEEDETKLKAEFNRERITKKKQGQRILHQHRHWANDTAGANCSSLLPKPAWNFPMTDTLLDEDTLRYVEKKYGTSSSKKLLSPTGSSPLFNSTKENYSVHSARLNSTCFDTSAKLNLHGSFFVGVNEMKNKQNQGDLEADGALGEMEFDEDWEAESVDTAEGHNGLEEQNYIENQLSQGYTEFVDDEEPPPPYSSEPEAAPTCPIVEVHSNKISPTHLRGENRDPAVYCKPTLQSLTEVVLPNPTNFDRLSCPSHSESSPPPYERNVKVSAAKDAYADDADTYSMKGFYGYYAKQQKEHRNIKAEGLEKSSDDDYEYDEAYPTSRATFSEKLPLLSNHEESLELLRKHLSGLEPGNPSWNERKSNQSPGQCSKPVSLLQNPSFSARNRNNYFVGANTVNPDRATAQEIEDYNRLYTKHVEEIEMKSLARYNSQIDDSISKQSLNMGIQACAVPKTAVGVGVTNNGSREQCIVEDAATSNTSLSAGSKRRARRKKIALAQANKVLDGCGTERCNNDTGLSPGIKLESVTPNHSGSNAIVIAEGRDTNVNANLSSPKADSDVDKFIVFNALNSNSGSLSNVSISSNASKLIGVSNSAKTRHASVSSNIAKSVDVSKLASNDSVAVSAASTVMTTSVVTSSVISNSKSTLLSPVTVAPSVSVFSVEEKLKVVTASGSELKIKKKKKKKKQAAEEDTIPPVCSKDTLLALEKEALAPAPALVANDSSADDDHRKQHRTLSAADDNVPKPVQLQALSRNGLISSKKKAKQVQNQTVPDSIASRDVTSDAGASGKANADISSGAVVDDEVETVDAVELFFMNRWKALSRSFGTSIENASNYQHVGTDVLNNGRKVPVIVIGKFGVHPSISPTSDCGRTSSSCGNDDEVPIAVSGSKKRRRGRNKKLSHQ